MCAYYFGIIIQGSSQLSMEKTSKRGSSATKGNKRILASQTRDGDYDLALSLHDMPETSPALSTAQVFVPPFHLAL